MVCMQIAKEFHEKAYKIWKAQSYRLNSRMPDMEAFHTDISERMLYISNVHSLYILLVTNEYVNTRGNILITAIASDDDHTWL